MNKTMVMIAGLALLGFSPPTPGWAAEPCPAEVVEAKAALASAQAALKKTPKPAKSQEIQAPRSQAGAKSQDIQAPRSQEIQAPPSQAAAEQDVPSSSEPRHPGPPRSGGPGAARSRHPGAARSRGPGPAEPGDSGTPRRPGTRPHSPGRGSVQEGRHGAGCAESQGRARFAEVSWDGTSPAAAIRLRASEPTTSQTVRRLRNPAPYEVTYSRRLVSLQRSVEAAVDAAEARPSAGVAGPDRG